MFNLTNETDYKLLYKTKNYYNFFILTILFLFIAIFIRLIFLSLDNEKNNSQFNSRDTTLKVLPTIYDLNKKTLAYSSYNFSVKNIKNKVQYLNRDIPLNDILELIYEGDPYIKFEKILTRKYPYSSITNNLIGHTNIEHQGVSLIEKFVDKNRNDIELSLDIQIQKKIYDSLYNDTNNLNPDYAMNVLIDLSSEEIVSNVFIDNRDLNKFDQTLLPLKDLKYDFGSVFKTFTVYSAIKNQKIELNEYFDVDQPVYIGDKIINDYPRNSNIPMQVKDILKKHGTLKMQSYPFTSAIYNKLWLRYFRNVKVLKPLNYIPYIKEDAMQDLKKLYNWTPYPQKHFESRFTRFYEGHWLTSRFNYDMRKREYSSLILTKQMSRDDALIKLKKPALEANMIKQELEYVANKLDISQDELNSYHKMEKKFYWNYKNQEWLYNLGEKVLGYMTGTRRGGAL